MGSSNPQAQLRAAVREAEQRQSAVALSREDLARLQFAVEAHEFDEHHVYLVFVRRH